MDGSPHIAADAVRTTCPYCGVGCGVIAEAGADGAVTVKGDPDHPANFGRLCSKGSALGETLSLESRLLHPLVDGERTDWDTALDLVAGTFEKTIAVHGPESVAFYVSGQLLTEDYYVANKLMKGFIGTANIDTNSRLCMASSVAGHKRAFGSDTVPGTYEDLELADLVVLVGSNLAWCHPVLFQRLEAARESRGTRVVVIDPRETATCEIADLHLPIRAGADVALFNGLLGHLAGTDAFAPDYVAAHTTGFDAAVEAAAALPDARLPEITGLSTRAIRNFFEMFESTERVVTVYSQGVNQSTVGTDKVNAIINCHLATGRIGRPGMGPFSVTGQPNAMGGREVGGLANMLAAHMDLDNPAHRQIVQAFWQSPEIADKPGLKAVDMFRAVADGRIKAIWIMATNPVDSIPEADLVRQALADCPFVVVSDVERHTDTTAMADVLLPSSAWGEKSGTVTNSERRISRQRPFLATPGEARPDWWQLAEVGKRMGFASAFGFPGPAEVFVEYAQLTTIANDGGRDLSLEGLDRLDGAAYDALAPVQWPTAPDGRAAKERFFAGGGFYHADGLARFVPTPLAVDGARDAAYPFTLNTGRIRDQWHTMTRTVKAPRLVRQFAEPFLEISPADAARLALVPGAIARVESPHGSALLRVLVTNRVQQGTVFAPMHWTGQFTGAGRVDALVPGACDPVSGQPGLKQAAVSVAPFPARWFGFAVTRNRPRVDGVDYWALAPVAGGWRLELAGAEALVSPAVLAEQLFGESDRGNASPLAYQDPAAGTFRAAAFEGDALLGALFIAREPVSAARDWLADQLSAAHDDSRRRLQLLAGRPGADTPDPGPTVCACFEVGLYDILAEIKRTPNPSPYSVGAALNAGTNCGSCRAEIGRLCREACLAEAG